MKIISWLRSHHHSIRKIENPLGLEHDMLWFERISQAFETGSPVTNYPPSTYQGMVRPGSVCVEGNNHPGPEQVWGVLKDLQRSEASSPPGSSLLCPKALCSLGPATQSALQVGRAHPVLAKVVLKQRCALGSGPVGAHSGMVTRE